MTKVPSPKSVFTLRLSLALSDPEIWRRFQVTDVMTLSDLHDAIQIVMGWTDSHLHSFTIDGKEYTKVLSEIEMDESLRRLMKMACVSVMC